MRLAFSTNAFVRFSLLEALEEIREAKFVGVEILGDEPHAYPGSFSVATARRAASELSRLELRVSNFNCNCSFGYWRDAPPEPYFEPSVISPVDKQREDRIDLIGRGMKLAKAMGARNISITSGKLLGSMSPVRAAAQFEQSMLRVLKMADENEIDVGIECEPGLFIEYTAELREWIDRLKHPRLGANLDIGHSQVMGESIPHSIDLLGDRIWNLHVEDIPGRKHYHLIPGEGSIDWPGLKGALCAIGYERWMTVELYTHTENPQFAAGQSFRFLSKFFAE